MRAEELAEKYADEKLMLVDPEFAKSSYLRHNKMGVRFFSGDDIEEAYQDGYEQAEKDLALTPDDIKFIKNICHQVFDEVCKVDKDFYEVYPTEQDYLKEVVKRFNEERNKV